MDIFEALKTELVYKAVRSSGSGGQHVNKVATKIELYFNVSNSKVLDKLQKEKLLHHLGNRVNKNGMLVMSCGKTRSQLKNKTIVNERFIQLIEAALKEEKQRIATKIPKAVKQKRLLQKRKNSEKKTNRKPPKME